MSPPSLLLSDHVLRCTNHLCRILQKCSLVQTAKILERDSQRQELSKLKLSQAELNSALESLREELHKLTQQASAMEQQLARLRRHYEHGVQERNDLGLQLIERNEEVWSASQSLGCSLHSTTHNLRCVCSMRRSTFRTLF